MVFEWVRLELASGGLLCWLKFGLLAQIFFYMCNMFMFSGKVLMRLYICQYLLLIGCVLVVLIDISGLTLSKF